MSFRQLASLSAILCLRGLDVRADPLHGCLIENRLQLLWRYGMMKQRSRKPERGNIMQCPICNGEMITGDIVCKTGAGPTFYPRKAGETELKHICRMFFGSRESIKAHDLDGGWYCPNCKKVMVLWNQTC